MVIKGYKAFDNGLINRYGKKFELEKTYTTNGRFLLEIMVMVFIFVKI